MYYTVKDMANCLDITYGSINNLIFSLRLPFDFQKGFNHERYYSIYKMELIKNQLEGKARAFKLELDYKNKEVWVVYESKVNCL